MELLSDFLNLEKFLKFDILISEVDMVKVFIRKSRFGLGEEVIKGVYGFRYDKILALV